MDKMRRCPFCGSQVQKIAIMTIPPEYPDDKPGKGYAVQCGNEECIMNKPNWYRNTREEAVKVWNDRGYTYNELFETVEAYQTEIVPGYLAKLTKAQQELACIYSLPSCKSCGKANFCRYDEINTKSIRINCPLWSGRADERKNGGILNDNREKTE